MPYTTLISPRELAPRLAAPDCIVFDTRHDLQDTVAGRNAYAAGHIPGAFFLHLDEDLSGTKNGRNGRHPLPDKAVFIARLAVLGVSDDTQVIAYDAHGGMFAARLWWMLRWIGHPAVAVLDGGLQAWQQEGLPVTAAKPAFGPPGTLTERLPLVPQVGTADVMANFHGATRLIVDARAPDRFRGENETLDPVGGHIPGARNRFFKDNLDPSGRFKPAQVLLDDFTQVTSGYAPQSLVMQCGSGVTACHNLLALEVAGLSGAALYPGSWSEWCSDASRPVSRE